MSKIKNFFLNGEKYYIEDTINSFRFNKLF